MSEPNQFEDERAAVEIWFQSQWNSATPIRYENQPWVEPTGDRPYVALTIKTGVGNQIDLRAPQSLSRYSGTVIVQVFQKERTGTVDARKLVGRIAEIFRQQVLCHGSSGNLRFRIPNAQTIGTKDGWYQINVNCPYLRDLTHTRPY